MTTDALLQRALEHFERETYDKSLELLIDAWRDTRAIEIAEAVELVDKLHSGGNSSATKATADWTAEAKKAKKATERGPLIRSIVSMTTRQTLAALSITKKWDDPRVGTLVIRLLTELRVTGTKSQPFWRGVFGIIPEQRDPRYTALMTTLPQTWSVGPSMQRWLTNHLRDAAAASIDEEVAVAAPLSAKQLEKVTQIQTLARERDAARAKTAASLATGQHGGEVSAEQLLADIYANPRDDAARIVYADWLLERGDPRGEFISLQLRADKDKDKEAMKRERALLKEHKKAWLGALAPMLGGDIEFRRGFLSAATVKFRHQRDAEQFGSMPEWATVEELHWGGQLVRDDQVQWAHFVGPAMCHVRVMHDPYAKFLIGPGGNATIVWNVEELYLDRADVEIEIFHAILASKRLPKLHKLSVGGNIGPLWLEDVKECCVKELSTYIAEDDIADWRKLAKRIKPLETLEFVEWRGAHYRFSRDSTTGEFSRLDVVMRPRTKIKDVTEDHKEFETAIATIKKMQPNLTHFHATIEVNGAMVDAPTVIKAGTKKIRA